MNLVTSPLKVSTRLALSFGAITVIGIAIAVYGAVSLKALSGDVNELAHNRMVKMGKLAELKDSYSAIAQSSRNVIISDDAAFRSDERKKIVDLRVQNSAILGELEKSISQPEDRERLKIITDNRSAYNDGVDRAIELAVKGDKVAGGAQLFGQTRILQTMIFKAADDLSDVQGVRANSLAVKAERIAGFSMLLMTGLALLMGAIGAVVAWLLSRSLHRALGAEPAELSSAAGRVADGDLSQPLAVRDGDGTSVMAAMARMQASLNEVVGTVRGSSENVATASAQIAQGNQDLSQRTEEQASALEQTAATMDELGSTVRNTADNAQQANQLARSASSVATRGGEVVGQVVDTMKAINESSTKVADITGVIDSIAFQTNILALNAAVEAARAGEQGRGFAVVASEVRSLAQRSAEAAKEIKILIGGSVKHVERGTSLVAEAGQTMDEIVGAIQRVSDIVGEISEATKEQSTGVSQVGEAVSQMDKVTQQNAALVEESAAAAASLKGQAEQLVQAVAVFRLDRGNAGPTFDHGTAASALTRARAPNAEHRGPDRQVSVAGPLLKSRTAATPLAIKAAATAGKPTTAKSGADDWQSF
ncbi:methyl-accepting chemotaxis protein [Pseudorhodoferax sp. Leaf265]|uniref:methyl-accepting chemotaxis protein n=1 Tax=Pseudorhodoferax sp. Leaf265 TaxID=1736315 RepID=UPI0006FB9BE6|nr:methyl-accepting chemotaxis protein [Pseudorhodoferax sp. Leaf265]KQP19277.1 chemotaxis protein [Pseudorhodoferax sp. Leaf265]